MRTTQKLQSEHRQPSPQPDGWVDGPVAGFLETGIWPRNPLRTYELEPINCTDDKEFWYTFMISDLVAGVAPTSLGLRSHSKSQ